MKEITKRILAIIFLIVSFVTIFSNKSVLAADLKDDKTYSAKTSEIEISSSRGTTIHATSIVPDTKQTEMALVIMCHGYTGNRKGDGNAFITLGETLAQNGIAAITIDFPGCGDSDEPDGNYTLSNMSSDIQSAISYMQGKYSNIASGEIGLVGHSMGGRIASQNLGSAKIAALWAPANGDGANGLEFLSKGSFNFGASDEFKNEMNNSHPNSSISSFSGPVLVAFDSDDINGSGPLSTDTANQTKDALQLGSKDSNKWLEYSDNHNFDSNRGELIGETADFMCNFFVGHDAKFSSNDKKYHYTIEDIVYNRVPILDVNVFSDTAGGEAVTEGSVTDIIRKIVATWYVGMRNLTMVVLVLLLVYTGIRIAIATVASDKAKYKQMLIGWIKSLIVLITLHYLIMFVFIVNDAIVGVMDQANTKEGLIYETIRTRAYDFRFSIGVPGAIMYIVLIMTWVKFLWLYVKRLYTVMILIITAPLVTGKYVIEAASGKRSTALAKWMVKLTSNVLIQAAHALLYTSLIGIALNMATVSIAGFVLALMFMRFMLSSDKLVLGLFKFNGGRPDSETSDVRSDFKKETDLAGALYTYKAIRTCQKILFGIGGSVARTGKHIAVSGYNKGMDALDQSNGKDNRRIVSDKINGTFDGIDRALLKMANPNEDDPTNPQSQKLLNQILVLRMASRKKGDVGKNAKKALKLKVGQYGKSFTSTFKFIKSTVKAGGEVILAVPVAVMNPTAGLVMGIDAIKTIHSNGTSDVEFGTAGKIANIATAGMYGNRKEEHQKSVKKHKKIDKLILHVQEANATMDRIQNRYSQLETDSERTKAKEMMKKLSRTNIDSESIHGYMQDFLEERGATTFKDLNADDRKEMALHIVQCSKLDEINQELDQEAVAEKIIESIQEPNETQQPDEIQKLIDKRTEELENEGYTYSDMYMDSELSELTDKFQKAQESEKDTRSMEEKITSTLMEEAGGKKYITFGEEIGKLKKQARAISRATSDATEEDEENISINKFIERL